MATSCIPPKRTRPTCVYLWRHVIIVMETRRRCHYIAITRLLASVVVFYGHIVYVMYNIYSFLRPQSSIWQCQPHNTTPHTYRKQNRRTTTDNGYKISSQIEKYAYQWKTLYQRPSGSTEECLKDQVLVQSYYLMWLSCQRELHRE